MRGDKGLTVVFVGLLTTLILLLAALVIDGGVGYQSHRQSQNASDAGAMAGVRVLEQLNFFPACGGGVTTACTTYNSNNDIAAAIEQQAEATGADVGSGGVQCWLLNGNTPPTRLAGAAEFCASNAPPSTVQRQAASGIEVQARQTKSTYFAKLADHSTTTATTSAKAFIYNFVGGTGSPFVICGDRSTMPSGFSPATDWSYDLVTPNGSGGYVIKAAAVNKYYQVQGSQNPSCGGDSNTFKGKSDGFVIKNVPYWDGITTGNGFSNQIQISVAGLTPCAPGVDTFNGCGMLIPIADVATGSGTGTQVHIVTWLAWQVWGSGNSYTFSGFNSDALGSSCGNPITAGGSMKYCGKLLGAVSTTAGTGSGPGTAGQPHILRLVD
jgi:hypothetical protein